MTTWASEMSSYRDMSNNVIPSVKRYVVDSITDNDGQFTVDISLLNLSSILEVQSYLINQFITPTTDTANILQAHIVEVSTNTIKGVILKGNSITISLGSLVKTLLRGGAGVSVRLVITCT